MYFAVGKEIAFLNTFLHCIFLFLLKQTLRIHTVGQLLLMFDIGNYVHAFNSSCPNTLSFFTQLKDRGIQYQTVVTIFCFVLFSVCVFKLSCNQLGKTRGEGQVIFLWKHLNFYQNDGKRKVWRREMTYDLKHTTSSVEVEPVYSLKT